MPVGLAWLPGQDLDRAFMFMGYGFCLGGLHGRQVRPRQPGPARRHADVGHGGLGRLALAMALTGWGLWRMEINPTYKAFPGVAGCS